jgi:N6-L-threonylcarbamoyladenine synthase
MLVLGIETSCDETAAAVVERVDGRYRILSSVVTSQIDLHARFGGVVPEIASRAHLELLPAAVSQALEGAGLDGSGVDAVAATVGPGLIGALLVGVSAAKALAFGWDRPFVGVNHLEAHLFAPWLETSLSPEAPPPEPPLVVLLVSGGHTMLIDMAGPGRYRLLGQTLDDAAGEALDKGARMLGLGFPGGPAISSAAWGGDPSRYDFPVALKEKNNLDFSFSGLKTSLLYKLKALDPDGIRKELPHLAAGYEAAVIEALSRKLLRAAELYNAPALIVVGGVAANISLRRRMEVECERHGIKLVIPPPELCTDNAAMIGAAAAARPDIPFPDYLGLNARSV